MRTFDALFLVAGACLLAALPSACRSQPAPPLDRGASPTLPPGHPPVGAASPLDGAARTGSVAGTIAVSPGVEARAEGGVLFVIARSSADKGIVAVRREDGVSFPFRFKISGADAMIAGTPFAGPLDITARLSKSGDALPARGDVEGVARGVAVGAGDVQITLDTVRE